MPNKQRHRGQHPRDKKLFSVGAIPQLRNAVIDYSWLLSRGYTENLAIKTVIPRYKLTKRQANAVSRVGCSDENKAAINNSRVVAKAISGQEICIDAFNVIITLEAILSRGLIFKCRDGCFRDIASVHGTYRRVSETESSIAKIGEEMNELNVERVNWLLDAPVSNSHRLGSLITRIGEENHCNWKINLVNNPDKDLVRSDEVVITSDGNILSKSKRWFNLNQILVEKYCENENLIDLVS